MTLPLHRPPGTAPRVRIGTTTETHFLATGRDTGGRFGIFEHRMLPGAPGAAPHIHRTFTEAFYVVTGSIELTLGEHTEQVGPGTFMAIPEETVHGFRNVSDEDATMLIFSSPAQDRERYFEGLAELTRGGRVPDREQLVRLMAQFDQYEL